MLAALLLPFVVLGAPTQIPYDTMFMQVVTPEFFEKSDWNTHWNKGDLVVLGQSQFDVQTDPYVRPPYDPLLSFLIDRQERKAVGKGSAKEKGLALKALTLLKKIKTAGVEGRLDGGGSIVPPTNMLLDRETVVFVPSKDLRSLGEKVVSQMGVPGTVRFAGEMAPPSYSPNRKYAIARLKSARERCIIYFLVAPTPEKYLRPVHVDVVWVAGRTP